MEEIIHTFAAEEHLKVARQYDETYSKEKGADKKIALRIVAAQNYFYAIVNAIEAILAKKGLHSFSHENRLRKVLENNELFDNIVLTLYPLIERNERNKVTYRGKNGQMYKNIKRLAESLAGEAG